MKRLLLLLLVVVATWGGVVWGDGMAAASSPFTSPMPPSQVSECKNDGWQNLTRADGSEFTNQGDCIQYVNTGK